MTPYETYCSYLKYKKYFTDSDFDLGRSIYPSKVSLEKRKDKHFFDKAAKKYTKEKFIDLLISNFVYTDNYESLWIKDFMEFSAEEIYSSWKKKMESLSYGFEQDINFLKEQCIHPKNLIRCTENRWPKLLHFLIKKQISLETFIIILDILNLQEYFQENLSGDPIWKFISLKIKKYRPFLKYDIQKFKDIIKNGLIKNVDCAII